MILKAFFVVCFYVYGFSFFALVQHWHTRLAYFNKINLSFAVDYAKNSLNVHCLRKFLPQQCGAKFLKSAINKGSCLLYPQIYINLFCRKFELYMKNLDKKLNSCKLKFKTFQNVTVLQNLAKFSLNLLIFEDNSCFFKQILNNLSKTECKYFKLLLQEEIAKWMLVFRKELDRLSLQIALGEACFVKKVKEKFISPAFVVGLSKNPNALCVLAKFNVNEKELFAEFFEELKFYYKKTKHLSLLFNQLQCI